MGEALLSPARHGLRPMKVVILDGYVDEPSNFGVPPYISPYPRYLAGAVRDAGHDWEYATIDQVRAGRPIRGDILAIISGPIVPGKYLRGLPISEREIVRHASIFQGETVLGGPLARFRYFDESLSEPFDWVALRDYDACLHDRLAGGEWKDRDRTDGEWDRWALLGADVIRCHPDFPNPLIVELDTSKGCVRYVNKGCSFCVEPMEAMRLLVRYATSGTLLSFGLETADPAVTEANNLNIDADGCLEAVRMVNAVGRERGENGMPRLLPGLNFVAGLEGETSKTFDLNLAFLKQLLEEDLWVRRVNIRQVRPVRREFEPTGLYREFRRFKEAVRTLIDHEMLQRVIPEGTVLRSVFLEIQDGHVTYGRQIGTYPILVGLPYDMALNRFVDVRVTSHGQRSLTAIEYPLDVNRAPLAAICALPGIGEKRAARIVRARPFDSWPAFAASLDDPAVAQRVAPFLGLAA